MAFTDEEIAEFDSIVAAANQLPEEEEETEAAEPRLDLVSEPVDFSSLEPEPEPPVEQDEDAFWSEMSDQYGLEPVATAIPRSLGEELGVGFDRGVDQTQGLGYGFVGLLGQAVGLEGVEEYGVENYLRKMEEAALNEASVRDPFEEIDDLGDAGLYAAGIIGEQIPQLLASALGGGIGGLAAKTIGKRIVGNMINKRVAAGMARDKAAEEVAKETAGTLLGNAGRAGGVSGAYLANFGQISGGSFGQMAQELGRGDAGIAAAFAVPGSALDTLGEVFIASKFLKPFSKAQRAGVDGVDTSLSLGRIGGGAATGFAGGSVIEGGTEYVQTGLEQAALGAADPNRTIEDVVMTPEAGRERLIAAAAGATVGAPLGGVGGAFEVAFSPRTTEELNRKARQKQTTQQQQQTETTPAILTTEGWEEPVTVGENIRIARSRNGLFAGIDLPEELASDFQTVTDENGRRISLLVDDLEVGEKTATLIQDARMAYAQKANLLPQREFDFVSGLPKEESAGDYNPPGEDDPGVITPQPTGTPPGTGPTGGQAEFTFEAATSAPQPSRSPGTTEQRSEPATAGTGILPVEAAAAPAPAPAPAQTTAPIAVPPQQTPAPPSIKGELDPDARDTKQATRASETLSRPVETVAPFVESLKEGDRVSVAMPNARNRKAKMVPAVFAQRLENGDAVFQLEDGKSVMIPPEKFNRVGMFRPEDTKTAPVAKVTKEQLGPTPTKAKIEQTFGVQNYKPGQTLKQTVTDGNGDAPVPVLTRLLKKKGSENDYLVDTEGEFTNDPLASVRQMNAGLPIYLPENQDLNLLSPDIEVTPVEVAGGGTRNKVTAVNLWGRTYRQGAEPSDFSVSRAPDGGMSQGETRGLGVFNSIYRLSPERMRRSAAGMQAARTREQAKRMKPEELAAGLNNLDPVDQAILEDGAQRALAYINRKTSTKGQATTDETRDAARDLATDSIMIDVVKAASARKDKLPAASVPVARRVISAFNDLLTRPIAAGQRRDTQAEAQRAGESVIGELVAAGSTEVEARAAVAPIISRVSAISSPISAAEDALKSATKTAIRTEANQAAATADLAEGTVGEAAAPTSRRARPLTQRETNQAISMGQRRDRLSEEDKDLMAAAVSEEELNSLDAARVEEVTEYLNGNTEYEALYPEDQRPRQPSNVDNVGRSNVGREVSGTTESRAGRTDGSRSTRGAVGVGGPDRTGSGTVPGVPAQQDGGSGVRVSAGLTPAEQRARALGARRFLIQRYFRLTDEEVNSKTEGQLDRAYDAIRTVLSPTAANQGRRAVAATKAQQVADLADARPEDLLAGVAQERAEALRNRQRTENVRRLAAEMFRGGAFDSTRNLLEFIANTKSLPRDMQLRAKSALGLQSRGFNWNNVATQIGIFRNRDGSRTTWAGLLGKDRDGGKSIAINLDNGHDRGTTYQTFLHEIQHVLNDAKWDAYYGLPGGQNLKLNKTELAAIKRVENFWKRAVKAAAEEREIAFPDSPTDADYARIGEELYALSDPSLEADADRRMAALRNPRELSVEITSSPEVAELLAELGFGKADKDGKVAVKGAIKEAWDALVQLEAGTVADAGSPLAMAFKDAMAINFADTGNKKVDARYTVPGSEPSALTRELAEMRTVSDFIEAELERRGLPGTSEQRAAILEEYEVTRREPTDSELDTVGDPETMSRAVEGDVIEDVITASRATAEEAATLEQGLKLRLYRAMQVIDGNLYPPMSAVVEGGLRNPTEIGVWEVAEERPDLLNKDGKFVLRKGNGAVVPAAYNPYFHASSSPLNDQFTSANKRPNLVTVEVEVPASELTSGYRAEGAKNAVGEVTWNSGVVSSKLPADRKRKVVLSRYSKVVRVVPDSEVAATIANLLEGTNLPIPENTVTPSLKAELERNGVEVRPTRQAAEAQENLNTTPQMVSTTEQTNETESRATSNNSPNLVYQDSEGELRGRPRAATDRRYLRGTLLRLEQSSDQGRDLGAVEGFRFRADPRGQTDLELEGQRRSQGAAAFRRLIEILEEDGAVLDPETFENTVIEGRDKVGDGSEHQVHSDKPTNRVIKYTNPDVTGSGAVGQSLNVFEYLTNLEAQNEIFGDDIRLEGIVNLGDPYPRVVISQPFIKGRDSTQPEIDAYFGERGFEKQEDGSWIRVRDGQIQRVSDAVPSNLKTVRVGRKLTVVPFDVQVSVKPVSTTESRAVGPIESAKALVDQSGREAIKDEETFFNQVWPKLLKRTGRQLIVSPRNFREAARRAISDLEGFLRENPKFADYYNKDWELTRTILGDHLGRAITNDEFLMFRILAGLNSPNTMLPSNMGDAVNFFDLWVNDGNFDAIRLGPKPRTGTIVVLGSPFEISGTTQNIKARSIKAVEELVKRFGTVQQAVDFLQEPVTVQQLHSFNREMGYKGDVSKIGNIRSLVQQATGQDKLIPRMFIFGQKVGAYTLNAIGDSRYTTVDVWESRFIRSYFKGMFEQNTGLPVDNSEHDVFTRFNEVFKEEFEKSTGLKWEASALQAVRWFYIIDSSKKAGYSKASTNETISFYTERKLRDSYGYTGLGGIDPQSRAAGDGTGRAGTEGRPDTAAQRDTGRVESRAMPDVERNKLVTPEATVSGPALYSIAAYHGTPNIVPLEEGFRTRYIGTGEGAQVYGYGLYFAEEVLVAENYRKDLTRGGKDIIPKDDAARQSIREATNFADGAWDVVRGLLDRKQGNVAGVVAELRDTAEEGHKIKEEYRTAYRTFADLLESGALEVVDSGNLYAVELDTKRNELLDWDVDIDKQNIKIQNKIKAAFKKMGFDWDAAPKEETLFMTGGEAYTRGKALLGNRILRLLGVEGNPSQKLSEALLAEGIPGIRYVDQGSRGLPDFKWKKYDGSRIPSRGLRVAIEETGLQDRLFAYVWENKEGKFEAYYEQQAPGEIQDIVLGVFNTEKDAKDAVKREFGPTYNYVIFDENLIKITERNGQPVSLEQAAREQATESRAVSPQQDADYLAAVERGDMETAQRMVDEVARRAGYVRKVYHGTEDGEFTTFDPEQTSKKTGYVYFSTDRGTAQSYSGARRALRAGERGRGILDIYVKDPDVVADFEEAAWNGQKPDGTTNEYYDSGGIDGIARDGKMFGWDSFEVQNVLDEGPNGDTAWYASTIAVADPTFIKSADPVTRDDQGNVIPLSQRFNVASPDIRESRATGRFLRERVRVTPTGGTISQGGMFSVDELLPEKVGDAFRSSRMAIKADVSVITELSRLLERQMKSLYRGQEVPRETINTALGNLENPLNSQQIAEIESLFNSRRPKQATKKRDQFIRENRKRFREETQPAALAQLPEELAATIREMSTHIESLSRRLVEKGGPVSGNLAVTVDEALGTYLNRSYAIFDDPNWSESVRKNAKVMDAARKFIRNGLTQSKTADLIDDAASEGRVISLGDAQSMANDSVTDAEIEAMLDGYLAVGDESPSVEILSGRIPGQKNLSMLNPRGNIAPEIQALWGRYEDPTVNYAKTVMKLSSVIANNQFLTDLRKMGVEEGWLWSTENNPGDLRHPPGYVRISTENNPALAPIGGMYAHPMLAEGLFKMFPVGSIAQHYWWLSATMKLTGISMAMKTVGSVASQVRNYFGNYLNLVATGNLGLGDIASGDFAKRFNNSTDTVLASTFNKYRNATRAEWRIKIDDYIRRGIVGESVTTGLLEDMLTASRRAGSPDFGDVVWSKVSEPFKRVTDFAVKTYSAGDDWFKVMIYEAEQDKYRKAFPEWDDNKVKETAAKIARDIHWTYSLAPAIVQDLKKFPFIAPFVTFTTEVIRTTYNLQKLARKEIMDGRASGNKELEAMGWKRVRGMTTAAFLPLAVGSASMALAGISGEDEEDLRRFLPDWQKNSQLILFRKESGEVSFLDVSFLDPYEYFKKPLIAFMRSLREADSADEILLGGTMAMVRQALDPFTSEQIFAGAIMDVMRNQDAAGRQVYNPQDTAANIGTAVASKIFIEPFTPGTLTSFDRIGKAAFGMQSESGRAYGLFNEIASVTTGQRISKMDAQQALQFKGSRFMREMRDASALFNREFVSQGTRSAGDVVSGYDRSNGARRALVGSIRKDYLAAIRLGVPVARAKAILRDAGVGRETLRMATTGIYKPFEASEDSVNLVRARGNRDRITAYNQARRATPAKEVLP